MKNLTKKKKKKNVKSIWLSWTTGNPEVPNCITAAHAMNILLDFSGRFKCLFFFRITFQELYALWYILIRYVGVKKWSNIDVRIVLLANRFQSLMALHCIPEKKRINGNSATLRVLLGKIFGRTFYSKFKTFIASEQKKNVFSCKQCE